MGLNKCAVMRKPIVNETNQKERLQFARSHKYWTFQKYKKVTWSVTLFQCDGRMRLRWVAHEVMHQLCIVATAQVSGGTVMISGCFCWVGLGSATFNKMKSADYKVITYMEGFFFLMAGIIFCSNRFLTVVSKHVD